MRADAVLESVNLDDPPVWWPQEMFAAWRLETAREVLLHVVTR